MKLACRTRWDGPFSTFHRPLHSGPKQHHSRPGPRSLRGSSAVVSHTTGGGSSAVRPRTWWQRSPTAQLPASPPPLQLGGVERVRVTAGKRWPTAWNLTTMTYASDIIFVHIPRNFQYLVSSYASNRLIRIESLGRGRKGGGSGPLRTLEGTCEAGCFRAASHEKKMLLLKQDRMHSLKIAGGKRFRFL